ncbi:MAG: type I restriction enzyme HsdR N-terminal domain-containing protein [Bacteroidetes bacterium]|nr:type I restriction enzyme HsdR N-terminal domain-containing protein [Bacteroidota bacterium]
MPKLNLPEYDFRQRTEEGRQLILDVFRKRYVALTPEEEVRQRFARYLVEERHYPASLIQTEYTLNLNGMVRRCDILVDKPAGTPSVLVECKAPNVKISQETFDQAARYNMVFRVRYLMVTNGIKHYCCRIDFETRKVDFLENIPGYQDI